MSNKEKANKLMYELQNCFNETYLWQEIGDAEELTKVTNRITKIRQEVLELIND